MPGDNQFVITRLYCNKPKQYEKEEERNIVIYQEVTHESVLVGNVVCEFEFLERDSFGHPLFARAGGIRMNVHPSRHLWIRLPRHHPAGIVELVAAFVHGDHIHEENVLGALVQSGDAHLERREHTSGARRKRRTA